MQTDLKLCEKILYFGSPRSEVTVFWLEILPSISSPPTTTIFFFLIKNISEIMSSGCARWKQLKLRREEESLSSRRKKSFVTPIIELRLLGWLQRAILTGVGTRVRNVSATLVGDPLRHIRPNFAACVSLFKLWPTLIHSPPWVPPARIYKAGWDFRGIREQTLGIYSKNLKKSVEFLQKCEKSTKNVPIGRF